MNTILPRLWRHVYCICEAFRLFFLKEKELQDVEDRFGVI